MIKGLDYWYDGQMRRFLEQIVRAFSGFQYMTGWRELSDGTREPPQLKMVPCRLGSSDRMIAQIMRNLSENTLLTVPMITVSHTGLAGRREDLQHPGHVDSRQVFERDVDEATGEYLPSRGRSYTVQRMMPRPFEMTIQVDLWTSNISQKHQLSEQILTVIYPDFAIQNSDNALDWTAMTYMSVEDINLTSRSIPIGTESEIDIMSITLKLPFWLSPPAKVMQQKVIEQIVTNIHDGRTEQDITDQNYMTRTITTPGNHSIRVNTGMVDGAPSCMITLLGPEAAEHTPDGTIYGWKDLLNLYGTLRQGESKLRLKMTENLDDQTHDIVGYISYEPGKPNRLAFQIDPDTLPGNTLPPINGLVDPTQSGPGIDNFPAATNGQRYLLVAPVAGSAEHPNPIWGPLSADEGAIIEYAHGAWRVSHSPVKGGPPQYVLNTLSGRQLRWNGFDWVLTVDGTYGPGMWRLAL